MTPQGRLAGKVAIVTGGGSGIGRAVARRFAAEGAAVAVADIAADHAKAVAAEIQELGGRAFAMGVDVTDQQQVQALVDRAVSEFGGLDVLMTAAGVLGFGSVVETEPDEWRRVIGVNLTGTYLCARSAIPPMVERGGGAIVTVSSSTGAHDAAPGTAAYVASKGGVPMLSDVMTPQERLAFGEAMPIGRLAQPEELAAAALFLASDEASYVTGAVFAVDGGQTAKVGMTLGDLGTIARQV